MKTIAVVVFCLVGALLSAAAVAVEPAKALKEIRLEYAMAVGPDGKATNLEPSRTLPEAVDQWIRARVGEYVFEPATVDGVPTTATTTLYLTLGPTPTTDGQAGYRIASLHTGPKLVKGRFDYYPRTVGAGYFIVDYDATGRVTDVASDESRPSVGSGAFRKWALSLARSFRFNPETVAGKGVPGRGRVPIIYCLDDKCPTLAPPTPDMGEALSGELVAKSVLSLKSVPKGS